MTSALKFLFESELTDKIVTFFRARGEAAHIIAPRWAREWIMGDPSADAPPQGASWAESPAFPVSAEKVRNLFVIAEDAGDERATLAALSHRKGMKSFGLFADVVPALLCGTRNLPKSLPTKQIGRYAIVSIPRSGSRYVAATLTVNGFGAPREHLREPLANLITDGGLGFPTAIESLERFGQRNEIFGTKLISSFLLAACKDGLPELEHHIGWMVDRGYQFILLDRPLNDAVISNHIASRLKKWHFFEGMDQNTLDFLAALEFDEVAAWHEYIRFRAQKAVISYLGEKFGFPAFCYATIHQSVDGIVALLRDRLKVDSKQLKTGSAHIPVPTRTESDAYEKFANALEEMLDRRQNDLLPRTIRTLRDLVQVDERMAERIATASVASR